MQAKTLAYLFTTILLIGVSGFGSHVALADPDPNSMVNQFEMTAGKFEGFRRSGAKGVCATGEFVGGPEGRNISSSSAFSGNAIPVIVRFSVGGANPQGSRQ